ncbi:asparagine--tRNA ligase [Blochmannia endosymbiont of Camponotus sp.]|uniref:asparagine--tRNA ligase n=1 Tax=Blochmannia endosymbiont of Camponotus sp. TaxID=700220 RepID=UPI002023E1B3|nr:asparagine--tRNA ligase [Blochmannia endosymbiont of Camponotus sp.]URJ23745.1 asparagine--tRNA ligase [Blochmannia endosymbiont of Camponotus sp.]URJ25494.1 asparagine--tRNA ligase [Blochmannia endosymbiont of Camponotus sp.]
MNVVSVVDILRGHVSKNTEITIQGWIRTRRDSKAKISFLDLYDGSCINSLQIIAHDKLHNYKNEILRLTSGCSVIIVGILVKSIGIKQHVEVIAKNIKILGWIDDPSTYPITAKKHTMEYLREFSHLRPRTNTIGAVARIRDALSQAIHNFLHKQEFIWIPTPIITACDTEGSSKMFCVSTTSETQQILNNSNEKSHHTHNTYDFFGKKAFLTVSGQLNAEAYACALSRVYTFGPTFRAEYSNTNRHLSEFWMIEPEAAFMTLDDIIILAESLLKNIIRILLEKHSDDIKYLVEKINKNIISILENFSEIKFNHIEYTEAIKLLKTCNKKFNNPIHWGTDLFSEHEKYLSEEYFKSPVIIKNSPKNIKAFYMRLNDDNKTVASMDILVPGIGEIIGGSQREERLSKLDQRLQENRLTQENYWWYRDLRRYGTVPHSGFGLGFERLMIYVTGIKNIRDVIPFPRTSKNINF